MGARTHQRATPARTRTGLLRLANGPAWRLRANCAQRPRASHRRQASAAAAAAATAAAAAARLWACVSCVAGTHAACSHGTAVLVHGGDSGSIGPNRRLPVVRIAAEWHDGAIVRLVPAVGDRCRAEPSEWATGCARACTCVCLYKRVRARACVRVLYWGYPQRPWLDSLLPVPRLTTPRTEPLPAIRER